nr:MAG TPA: putative chromosome-partitioning protein [Caudoviricetes sp.]
MKELKIDPELRDLLPPLTDDEYKQLEKNIVENGFDKNFPIMEWHGYIVDGHNRYSVCQKHNIEYVVGTLAYETKEEVMEWMLDIQLGRRNLSPIQRIAVAEKYRPIYEKQAKENKSLNGGDKKSESQNSSTPIPKENKIDVRAKLAKTAGVSTDTYSKGKKILDSDNEKLKKEVLSGEKTINAGYKELQNDKKKIQSSDNQIREYNINPPTTSSSTVQHSKKNQISDEVKHICEDLKTEKTKEYLDSIWDYKVSIIECMNADFQMYYDGFVSILKDMENRVTKPELDECIANAENNITKLLTAIELAKNTKLKMED